VRPRCQVILYDPEINSPETTLINFTQMMYLCALKSTEYIKCGLRMDGNHEFILRCIDDTAVYARNLIVRRLNRVTDQSRSVISEAAAIWLGRYAFSIKFQQVRCGLKIANNGHGQSLVRLARRAVRQFNAGARA